MDWRRSQIRRKKYGFSAGPGEESGAALSDENQRVRTAAWTAFYQVKLLCADSNLEALARETLEATRGMKRAANPEVLNAQGDAVRRKLDDFLDAASKQTLAGTTRR